MPPGTTTTTTTTTTSDPVEWYPARILRAHRSNDDGETKATTTSARSPFALVILNQPLRDIPTLTRLWKNSCLKVAADGGANRLLDAVKRKEQGDEVGSLLAKDNLDVIIGDLDSLSLEARAYFTTTTTKIIHDPDQESTDFGKAVEHIRSSSPSSSSPSSTTKNHNHDDPYPPPSSPLDIVAMGGLGGRVDQGLSQLHHLYLYQTDPDYATGRMFLVSEASLTFLLKGGPRKHRIHVRESQRPRPPPPQQHQNDQDVDDIFDKYVGIVPVKEPSVITTSGLEWDVTGWATEFGGRMSTSNHVLPQTEVVEVETVKDVLFTIALRKEEE